MSHTRARRSHGRLTTALSTLATTALALGAGTVAAGALLVAAPTAAAASTLPATATPVTETACTDGWVNPMSGATPLGAEHAYTLFVTGDALLANSELEGTLAVGGTARFGDPAGQSGNQYPIVHSIAGNADYGVPTIDGENNRVLLNSYTPVTSAAKVVQVKTQGGGPADAGVKLIDDTTPAGYTYRASFDSSGTTFWPSGGSNMSPQISSWTQPWNGGTFAADENAFAAYFPTDAGADILANADYVSPREITTDGDVRVWLDPSGPNLLTLSDLAGVWKFFIQDYSATAPLIVKISPSDVVGGMLTLPSYGAAGNASDGPSYLLWDLSEITGDVTVTAADGSRVRGSIYAPQAHITFPVGGPQFEGQLIAAGFTALQGGEELHTNLFRGVLPCAQPQPEPQPEPEVGGFSLQKTLDGAAVTDFADGTTFAVTATWDAGNGEVSQTFALPATGEVVAGPQDLPAGTVVTFDETDAPAADGFEFVGVDFSPAEITVTDGGNPTITAVNTYRPIDTTPRTQGGFALSKQLSGIDAAAFAEGTVFEITATWDAGDGAVSQTFALPASGEYIVGPRNLPAGTVVTFDEPSAPEVPGYTFSGVSFAPTQITIEDREVLGVVATNTYSEVPPAPPVTPTDEPEDPTDDGDTPTDETPTDETPTDGGDTASTDTARTLPETGGASPAPALLLGAAVLMGGLSLVFAGAARRRRG